MLILILIAALGNGLLAGLFFAFSCFIMKALAGLPSAQGIRSMQSINAAILNATFLTVFLGTAILSVVLAAIALFRWEREGSVVLLAGGLLQFAGCFLVTAFTNVPLNNRLAAVDPQSDAGAATWSRYLRDWVRWNHVRTVCSVAALAAFLVALGSIPN